MKYRIKAAEMNELTSLPAWGAWIEITHKECSIACSCVAPRMGGVD